MRWVTDRTGRFPRRPYYTTDELDRICEARVHRFLQERYPVVHYPLSTDDLMVLVEEDADDLDVCADLSHLGGDGADVEGVTTFIVGRRPSVQISQHLVQDPRREPRLRTTLSHELGHVLLHTVVLQAAAAQQLALFDEVPPRTVSHPCTAALIRSALRTDWMEWQAGYACGALLMPRSALSTVARPFLAPGSCPLSIRSPHAQDLIAAVKRGFGVSEAAARVRLLQRGHLSDAPDQPSPVPLLFTM